MLDLDEGEAPAFERHEVDLADRCPQVAFENFGAKLAQVFCRRLFACTPQFQTCLGHGSSTCSLTPLKL